MINQQDFFQVSGTLSVDAPSYIERPADQELLIALKNRELCLVLAPRQTGKSSLMVHSLPMLKEKNIAPTIVDLQFLGNRKDSEGWFGDIIYQINRMLNTNVDTQEWWKKNSRLGSTQRFITFLEDVILQEVENDVVIFFDEIDSVIKLPFSDDFFTTLRSLYNSRAINPKLNRLNFVLIGVTTASSFIKDRTRTPFNIGVHIEPKDFDQQAIETFEKVLGLDSEELIERIFYWTNGQPLLVQKIAAAVYSWPLNKRTWQEIDNEIQNSFFKRKLEHDTHLTFIQDYLLDETTDVQKTLEVYEKVLKKIDVVADDQSISQSRLNLAGVVRVEKRKLLIRNRIYEQVFNLEWVRKNTPNEEQKLKKLLSKIEKASKENASLLDLFGNRLSHLPDIIGKLTNLIELNLDNNQFTFLPSSIEKLTNLRKLYINNNQISSLPTFIGNLTNIRELHINNNLLTSLPESIGKLTNLRELHINNNLLTSLPESIGKLNKLTIFNLSGNPLTKIPESIGKLVDLNRLELGKIKLTTFPDFIISLTKLSHLDLNNNLLTSIPEHIGSLANLKKLNLAHNRLSALPESITNLTQLKDITIKGNQFKVGAEIYRLLPQEQFQEIIKWQKAQEAGTLQPIHEAKVIFIGGSNYGKTHLIELLKEGIIKREIKTTHGIERSYIKIPYKDNNIQLNIWDLGGQEFMRSTNQFYFSERTLYVLVTVARRERHELNYWLKLANQLGNEAPVLVVINKVDLDPHDIDRRSLERDYPNIVGFVRTSIIDSREGKVADNIKQLKNKIIEIVSDKNLMPSVFEQRPPEWFAVKQELEKLEEKGRDFITYEEYENLEFVRDLLPEERKSNLKQLNMVGAIISYIDDPRLIDTNVINPQWIMDGVWAIINDSKVKYKAKGQLHIDDLARILPRKKYPKARHIYLLELMRKFDLCYASKDQKGIYFIPDLFEDIEPEVEWNSETSMHIRYNYNDFPPDVFMTRFIVEMHQDIKDEKRWQSGVYISNGSCQAKIYQSYRKNNIHIEVIGNKGEGRSYLYSIREVFRKLHKPFPQMEIKQEVLYKGYWLDYLELVELEKVKETRYHVKLKEKLPVTEILNGYSTPIERSGVQKHIKVFLASSAELKAEREQFEIFIHRENQQLYKKGIFIELQIWENFIDAMSQTRLQDEYNVAVKYSDIFVSLFFNKVGKYTLEEFETAFGQFKKTGKPLVYTYFKDSTISTVALNRRDSNSLFDFQDKLKELEHYYTIYKSIEDLQLQFKRQLEKILPKL